VNNGFKQQLRFSYLFLVPGLSTTDSSLPIMVEGTDAPDMFKPAETGLFLKEGKYSPM